MTTWEEVCRRLETAYQAEALHDGGARKFVLEVNGGRTQVVLVYHQVTPQDEWVQISSPIGRTAEVNLPELLAEFEHVPYASVSLFAGDYVALQQAHLVGHTTPVGVTTTAARLAQLADAAELQFTGADNY